MIPWNTKKTWKEVNDSIDYIFRKTKESIKKIEEQALDIQSNLDTVFPLINQLCQYTCQFCPEPCCLVATVWFDFADLVFLHALKFNIPPGQLKIERKEPCSYLGHKGCILPRHSRPFVCTLYLCPPQMSRIRKFEFKEQDSFNKTIKKIKVKRKELENMFVNI